MLRKSFPERCDQATIFLFCVLIWFTPISMAIIEIASVFIVLVFFIKRWFIAYRQAPAEQRRQVSRGFRGKMVYLWNAFRPVNNPLNKAIAIYVLACLISIFFSQYYLYSIRVFLFKFLQGVFLFICFLESFTTLQRIQLFTLSMLSSALIVGLNGFTQIITGHGFIFTHPIADSRIPSSFKHPNDFGSYLISVIPVVFSLFFYECKRASDSVNKSRQFCQNFFTGRRKEYVLLVFLLLLTICLGFTFSRGAWLGFIVSMLFFGYYKKDAFWAIMLSFFLFFVIFTPLMSMERQRSLLSVQTYSTGEGRDIYWKQAVSLSNQSYVWGVGIGTYSKKNVNILSWRGYAHNCYLQIMAETGLFGLISFLAILFIFWYRTLAQFVRSRGSWIYPLLVGYAAGFLAFLLHGMVDTNFYSGTLGNLLWIFMALNIALQKIAAQPLGTQDAVS